MTLQLCPLRRWPVWPLRRWPTSSRRCFRHRIDRHHRETSRWVPGNQPSGNVSMVIRRTRFTDSVRSPRHPYSRLFDSPPSWHLYTLTFTTHGFHGESLNYRLEDQVLETHVDSYLRPPFISELMSVTLVWSRCVCGVMCHTPLSHLFSKWKDRSRILGTLELGVTLVRLSDRNLGRSSHSQLLWSWHRKGVVCFG
jgi:hypothetical protein